MRAFKADLVWVMSVVALAGCPSDEPKGGGGGGGGGGDDDDATTDVVVDASGQWTGACAGTIEATGSTIEVDYDTTFDLSDAAGVVEGTVHIVGTITGDENGVDETFRVGGQRTDADLVLQVGYVDTTGTLSDQNWFELAIDGDAMDGWLRPGSMSTTTGSFSIPCSLTR
jgi:hypothetical protein